MNEKSKNKSLKEFQGQGFVKNVFGIMGVSGNSRYLWAKVMGTDVIKNEISAWARGTKRRYSDTIIENRLARC